jgi:transmembrane sensor
MEEQQKIGSMLVDHFSSGSVLSEEPELNKWVNSSEDNKKIYQEYRKIWQGSSDIAQMKEFDADRAWGNVNRKLSSVTAIKRRLNNVLYATIGMAASLLIIFGLALYTNMFSFKGETVQMATNYGNRSSIVLPDGTSVKLNAGTNLEYRFDRLSKTREVKFNGEGFFEVAKSKNPFIIRTPDGLTLKVLGTKFNLKAYTDDNMIRTTLMEGKLELNSPGNKSLELFSGQIASYNDMTKELSYDKGQAYQDLGWVDNKLYMENMSLQEVCIILERWYDVKIIIEGNGLGNKIHYTGVLREETINDILNALCRLSEIKYQIKGKNISINKKQLPMNK